MKRIAIAVIALITLGSVYSCQTEKKQVQDTMEMKSKKDSASYALGIEISENFKSQSIDSAINFDLIYQGMKDNIAGVATIDKEGTQAIINSYFEELQKEQSKGKIAEGQAFLATKEKEEGVVKTESGLLYKVLTPGTGVVPKATDKIKAHYQGTLLDGTEFDSSYSRGEPAVFPVNGVIPGWVEALQLMKVGATWELYIPYELAYGERGAGRAIGPYETLIFKIELIEIAE